MNVQVGLLPAHAERQEAPLAAWVSAKVSSTLELWFQEACTPKAPLPRPALPGAIRQARTCLRPGERVRPAPSTS